MDERKKVVLNSFFLTVLIFGAGMAINHIFDEVRINSITNVMRLHEIDSESYRVEQLFSEEFGLEQCEVLSERISNLKNEVSNVGEELSSYSRFSFFRKKDYDYLKRKYFLLELRFLSLVERLNRDCGATYLPILFFYKIDDDDSERQGFILDDLSKAYKNQVIVLTLDKDYKDEPLVGVLAESYNITSAPAMVIGGTAYHGLKYTGEVNASLQKFIRRPDPFVMDIDFMLVPNAAGINLFQLSFELNAVIKNESEDFFARGDASIILGRLSKNDSMICESLQYFDKINSSNHEERALVFETIASIGCGRNRVAFLKEASKEWLLAGNSPRANLIESIAFGKRVHLIFDESALNSNHTVITGYKSPIIPILPKGNFSKVLIGTTSITLNKGDVLVSQDDRVYRDWLGGQLENPYGSELLTTFSEKRTYSEEELRKDIGWHEGARIEDLEKAKITHIPAVGTLVAKSKGRWFASDEKGVFRFEVPIDKVSYPTTRFLRRDLAVIIDSHGVNMLVEQAIRNNASSVMGCCDYPGKVYAAEYLSKRNISVICYPDKYLFTAIGHNLSAVGSPPAEITSSKAVFGNRPILLSKNDKIVVANSTDDAYALWYYQTSASYFDTLLDVINLNVTFVSMSDFGQMNKVVSKAREINASVIAARVFNKSDYTAIKSWLDEDISRRAILFHTASYPYGQLILQEYPDRVSFDDPNPVFIP